MSIKDIFKNLKYKKKYELRCPECGSKNIYKLFSMQWLAPSPYICKDCGYTGYILIEFEESKK
jgi:predicted RNA-binding Zn-ribbon protein involved in translation (DUF1610 family)